MLEFGGPNSFDSAIYINALCMFLPRALYRSHTSSVYEKEWALLKAERQCFDREVEAFRRTGGQLAGHYVGFGDAFMAAKEPRKEKQVLDSVANAGAHNPLNVEIQRQLDGEVRDFASQIRRCSNEDLAKIQRDLLSLRSAVPDE
eukprot:GEMP01089319.1.p1 GENE.GEMP01089319.1~~GEMP01089319.1.p1  ORF type:complete len:159 (+),score=24.25 GEMP01089319.1:43-477(+)